MRMSPWATYLLAAAAFALVGTAPGLSQADFRDGWAAYERGDYQMALRGWRPLATQGDAHAQFNLGFMYESGSGVPQDYTEAMKWYRKAAEQGNAHAQFNLGLMYDHGDGVPQDDAEAVKWYRLAAEMGDALGQFKLGQMYENGQGVWSQNHVQAMKWYRKVLLPLSLSPG